MKKKIIIGVVVLLVIASIVWFMSKKKKPSEEQLRQLNYLVDGYTEPKTGAFFNLRVNPDGSILIGDGYIGVLTNEGIVTQTRHGKPDRELLWKIV